MGFRNDPQPVKVFHVVLQACKQVLAKLTQKYRRKFDPVRIKIQVVQGVPFPITVHFKDTGVCFVSPPIVPVRIPVEKRFSPGAPSAFLPEKLPVQFGDDLVPERINANKFKVG